MIETAIGIVISAGLGLMAFWRAGDSQTELKVLTEMGASRSGTRLLGQLHKFESWVYVFGSGLVVGITATRALT